MSTAKDQTATRSSAHGGHCSFCHAHLPSDLKTRLSDGCHACQASWRDQYIAELLMGFECLNGVRSFPRLSQVIGRRNRRIAVIGRLFKRENTELRGQCSRFSVAQLRKVARRRMRLPVRAASLDYLLVSEANSMIFSLDEAARVLDDNGVLAVFWPRGGKAAVDHREQGDEKTFEFRFDRAQLDTAREAGLVGWYDRPGLGVPRIQHLQTFVAIKQPKDPTLAHGPD